MEKAGSNLEDPHEARINNVSMIALCQTIEIDLTDMLDESNHPQEVQAQDDYLYVAHLSLFLTVTFAIEIRFCSARWAYLKNVANATVGKLSKMLSSYVK